MTLDVGSVVADRFVLESVAGTGGMGTVYRAHDRQERVPVALKVCRADASSQLSRFSREVRVLAALKHPGIVGYVADGHTTGDQPFLAMEWLEGEDLGRRLQRAPLVLDEALHLAEQVSLALAVAHDAGVVHRDLKPSNVFLRGGGTGEVVLLDFGIARLGLSSAESVTKTGTLIGTPDYMSPEQARADREVGAPSDVFSLATLLFECLTGRRPFTAAHVMAVLAKIVMEEAPPLATVWPAAPPALEQILKRMFAKSVAMRPAARALAGEIAALRAKAIDSTPPLPQGPVLQGPEHQILSVVLAAPPRGEHVEQLDTLRITFANGDGRAEALADGSIAIAFGQTGQSAATDRAAQAARCALLLKEQSPGSRVAIATGRGIVGGGSAGNALERAAELLGTTLPEAPQEDSGVWIDEVTAGLIEAAFAVRERGRKRLLVSELASLDPSRPLLGKPTPCVGRELDLASLQATFAAVISEPVSRVVVVRAAPGMGKSRLRHEFLRRATSLHEEVVVLVGRCDLMSAGSSYGLLGQMIKKLTGAPEAASGDELRAELRRWAEARVPSEGRVVAAFLSELCEVPLADDDLALLRSARQDASVMAEQVTRAFVACLRAECAERPLLVVLEDLHWGDKPTVRAIGAALRELHDLPLLVLALGRPEIDDVFPRLWEEHGPINLTLRRLGRRACEQLCRNALGTAASPATVERIIEQSSGNALFLEELIRAVAEGKGGKLPESILAMLQARLMRLMPDARRVLRAASIFGETFWKSGVRALLGRSDEDVVEPCLAALVDAELIEIDRTSALGLEVGYRFRHALMRDAAYDMLAEDDRVAGHRAAGRFLEASGECDPMILARHFELGKDATHAGEWYARAAEQAHLRGDSPAVIARAELAVAQALPEQQKTRLLALIAEELGWQLDFQGAGAVAAKVLAASPPGSVEWAIAIAPRIFDVLLRNERDEFGALVRQICAVTPERDALPRVMFSVFAARFWNYIDGNPETTTELLDRQRELAAPYVDEDPLVRAWYLLTRAYYDIVGVAGPAAALEYAQQAHAAFSTIHHQRGALLARMAIGKCLWMLGRPAEAERALETAFSPGLVFGPIDVDRISCLLGVWLAQGRLDEAEAFVESSLATSARRNEMETISEGAARASYAAVLSLRGDLERAEEEARKSGELTRLATGVRLAADLALATVILERGRPAEALALATEVADAHVERCFHGPGHAPAQLLRADALDALGDRDGARNAVLAARAILDERAARIADPELRRTFFHGTASHDRIVRLTSD